MININGIVFINEKEVESINILSILAIILAIFALVPYCLEIYLYFTKKPKFKIQIANKTLTKHGKKRTFDLWLGIQPENISLIINKVILSLPFETKPIQHPDSSRKMIITPSTVIDGAEFGPAVLLDQGELPYHPKSGKVYLVRIVFDKEFDFINATLMIESEVDSLKLGLWSIFYKARRYRNQEVIRINTDPKRQGLTI